MDGSDLQGPSVKIPDSVIETLARCLLPKIQDFFDSPEGKEEYERWKQRKEDT